MGEEHEKKSAPARREVWTTSATGRFLGYSDDQVRRMCEAGRFPHAYRHAHSGHWRIPKSDVDAFMDASRPKVVRRKAVAQ